MTDTSLTRSTLTITAWNSVSRLTGFVRVLAVGAALGTTFLGNTYQSSNLVSNLLFEILASGLLSAPLIPAFVGLLDRGDQAEAEGLASSLLGLALVGLGVVVVAGVVAGHAVMRLLTVGVADAAVRQAEIRLGGFFLWFFLPQVLLYAVGAVASAFLNASRRFAAAAFAPVANNVVVTATMIAFIVVRGGHKPSLGIALSHKLLLAVGTTGGVLAMSAVPVLALVRAGYRLRPRIDLSNPHLRSVGRVGAWGAVMLAAAQVLIGVTLVLANRVEGGVVAYTIAYTFFLLPHAVIAHPLYTALYPRLAAHVHAGDKAAFAADVGDGVRRMAAFVLPASVALAVVAPPLLRLVHLGALDKAGTSFVARVLLAYALGLLGYSVFQLLARAATAMGDARLPALVGIGMTVGGAGLMVLGSSVTHGRDRVVVLGVAHSVAMSVGAAVMWALPWRRA
ncbi:MAG: putative peptidoglycan lipid flippase [Acidimicrobiaceae bacterium]|nr:putative peptidoglycan lipid flippase [Acidimicrobiaceae bacterium]